MLPRVVTLFLIIECNPKWEITNQQPIIVEFCCLHLLLALTCTNSFIHGTFTAGLIMVFPLFQSHAEDVLHNILIQSIYHPEIDREQVK